MSNIENTSEIKLIGYKKEPGFISVIAALAGNFTITILKAFGFMVSGSSALFSEAVHSLADTANQSLLLVGIVKSRRAPDEASSYGYGLERFFWALISACGVFFVGAGVTIYHGISTLLHPNHLDFEPIVFIILAISLIVESGTFIVAFRELWSKKGEEGTFFEILEEGDPTVLAVVYEDGVAVFGVLLATVSVGLAYITGNPIWDSVGSIFIGILLAWVAVVLIVKNKRFLVEKSIPEEIKERIIDFELRNSTSLTFLTHAKQPHSGAV